MVACRHCGTPIPAGRDDGFCCNGCAAAWQLIHEGGLAEFYRLRQQAGEPAGTPGGSDAGALAYDDPAFAAAWTRPVPGGTEIRWYVEGLHCPACTWLVERLPHLLPGVVSARLDLGAGLVRVVYAAAAPPGAQARLLATLGYRVRPWRADAVTQALRAEHRDLLLRAVVAAASAVGAMHLGWTLTAGEATGDLEPAARTAFAWGAILAALPACLWSAAPLHRTALGQLRGRRWGVDLAASLVVGIALVASAAAAVAGTHVSYADAAAMFIALLLTARLAVVAARARIARAAGGLPHLLPATVRHEDGRIRSIEALRPGETVVVEAGAVVPADGTALVPAAVDAAILTGEPRPLAVAVGDAVLAGTTCRGGELRLLVTAVGGDTRLGHLLAGVTPRAGGADDAGAERALAWFAPATVLVAVVAGLAWWWRVDAAHAIAVAVAVLMAACPCALGLAAPLSQALAAAAASRSGLLVRDPAVLARLHRLVAVVVDKTGTLTEGRLRVVAVHAHAAVPWPLVLGACGCSRHPISLAVAEHLRQQGVDSVEVAFTELPGQGVETGDLRLGSAAFTSCAAPPPGCTRVGISQAGRLLAEIDLEDPLRPDAAVLVQRWRAAGLAVHLASGDHPAAVAACAAQLGITHWQGGCTPADKAALVTRLRGAGPVAAIGDGVNDAAALAAADVAIGLRGGLEAAVHGCQVFCAQPEVAGPLALWELAAAVQGRVRMLVRVSLAYNALAVAGAAAGWFGPLICAVAMPLSSLSVVVLAAGRLGSVRLGSARLGAHRSPVRVSGHRGPVPPQVPQVPQVPQAPQAPQASQAPPPPHRVSPP